MSEDMGNIVCGLAFDYGRLEVERDMWRDLAARWLEAERMENPVARKHTRVVLRGNTVAALYDDP